MSASVASLGDAFSTVRANPRFTALTGIVLLVTIIGASILSIIPLIGQIASNAIIGVVGGGIIAAIAAGTERHATGSVSADDFTTQLSSYATTLLGTYLLAAAAYLALTIIGVVAVFGAALAGTTGGSLGQTGTTTLPAIGAGAGIAFVLFPIAVLLVAIPLQFLNVAVVIDDQSITGAFGEAMSTVINNPLSVIGYSLIRGIFMITSVLLIIAIIAGAETVNETLALASAVILIPVIGSVAVTVFYAHHTHYYRRLSHN